jgi:hypothetical protein
MSHVLEDNVASENRGGRRKFREMEDIALLREIVAKDAHVCRRGNVTENFEAVALALNEGNALPWNSNGKHWNDRYKLLANVRRADRARALAMGTDEEFGESDQQLADIHSAVNNNEERGRTGSEESAKSDERLAYSSRALSGRDVSQPLPSQCSLLFFVLHMEGFAAAPRRLASTVPGRRRGAVDARKRLGSGRGVLVPAARGDRLSPIRFYFHGIISTWVRKE